MKNKRINQPLDVWEGLTFKKKKPKLKNLLKPAIEGFKTDLFGNNYVLINGNWEKV